MRGGRHRPQKDSREGAVALGARTASGRRLSGPPGPDAGDTPQAAHRRFRAPAVGGERDPRAAGLPAPRKGLSRHSAGARRRGSTEGLRTRYPVTGRTKGIGGAEPPQRGPVREPLGLAGGRAGKGAHRRTALPPGAAARHRLLFPGRQRGGLRTAPLRGQRGGRGCGRALPGASPRPASPGRSPRRRGGSALTNAPLRACVTPPRRDGSGAVWRHTPREGGARRAACPCPRFGPALGAAAVGTAARAVLAGKPERIFAGVEGGRGRGAVAVAVAAPRP